MERLLVGAADSVSGEDELLEAAGAGANKLRTVLLSAWQAEGRRLEASHEHELDEHRARARRYAVAARLAQSAGSVYAIKGARIAAAYPPGFVRESRDLDLVAATSADAWSIARALLPGGWDVALFALMRVDGNDLPILQLERPFEGEYVVGDSIHLSAVALPGYVWGGISPRARLEGEGIAAGPAYDLLRLAAERLEREFAARDVVDAAVLLAGAAEEDREALRRLLDDLRLWPEWDELARRVARSGLLTEGVPSGGRRRRALARTRRGLRRASSLASPVRAAAAYAQLRMLQGKGAWIDRRLVGPARRRTSTTWAFAAGLPVFGARIDEGASDVVRLERRGRAMLGHTPIGVFALTASEEFDVGAEAGD